MPAEIRADRLCATDEKQKHKTERKEIRYGQKADEGQDVWRGTDVRIQGARRFERNTRGRFYTLAEEPRLPEKAGGRNLADNPAAGAGRASLSLPCGRGVARRPGVQTPNTKPVRQSGLRCSGFTAIRSPAVSPRVTRGCVCEIKP